MLSGFDQWFAAFKATKGYLFQAAAAPPPPPQTIPAATGPNGLPPPPPAPGALGALGGDGQRVDYRKMTPDQKKQYDRENPIG